MNASEVLSVFQRLLLVAGSQAVARLGTLNLAQPLIAINILIVTRLHSTKAGQPSREKLGTTGSTAAIPSPAAKGCQTNTDNQGTPLNQFRGIASGDQQ